MITVYTKPSCGTCDATKLWLKRNAIEFVELDIEAIPLAREQVEEMGYTSVPVVRAGAEHWSGFRIEKLAALKTFHPSSNDGVIEYE